MSGRSSNKGRDDKGIGVGSKVIGISKIRTIATNSLLNGLFPGASRPTEVRFLPVAPVGIEPVIYWGLAFKKLLSIKKSRARLKPQPSPVMVPILINTPPLGKRVGDARVFAENV